MALQAAISNGFDYLYYFGKEPLDEEMISLAERYLVFCFLKKASVTTFDELRYIFSNKIYIIDLDSKKAITSLNPRRKLKANDKCI